MALGDWGQTPGPVAEPVRALAEAQVPVEVVPADLDEAREEAGKLAASEEELCLVALFGEEALPLIERVRSRQRATDRRDAEPAEEARIKRLMTLFEESGLSELTVEEDGTRVTLRKEDERVVLPAAAVALPAGLAAPAAGPAPPPTSTVVVESPMVGTFYSAATPDDPPYVSVGDQVAVGQTLCILEAMKLFNELKSEQEGVVRRILVENAAPVEYGQPLFELEPVLS
jgi:oxaloacetate decarboxylase alpha subunit